MKRTLLLVAPVVHSDAVGDIIVNSPDVGNWEFDVSLKSIEAGKELITICLDAPQESNLPR